MKNRFFLMISSLVVTGLLAADCSNPQSSADQDFHPGVPSAESTMLLSAISSNECPQTAIGTLTLSLGSPLINGALATTCSVTTLNASLQGTPSCTCSSGVCSVSGLTLTTSFLTSMAPGVNSLLSNALTYTATSSGGTSSSTASLTVNTSTWKPTCLGSATLTMWLDASQSATLFNDSAGTIPITNGAGVGLWKDLSGNGYFGFSFYCG